MSHSTYTQEDFGRCPLMFYYEVTLACDLVCKHCLASRPGDAACGGTFHRGGQDAFGPGGNVSAAADRGADRRRSAQAGRSSWT